MAERHPKIASTVNHVYEFDRLLDARLHNAYSILVPQQLYRTPGQEQDLGDQDEDCRALCPRLRRTAES